MCTSSTNFTIHVFDCHCCTTEANRIARKKQDEKYPLWKRTMQDTKHYLTIPRYFSFWLMYLIIRYSFAEFVDIILTFPAVVFSGPLTNFSLVACLWFSVIKNFKLRSAWEFLLRPLGITIAINKSEFDYMNWPPSQVYRIWSFVYTCASPQMVKIHNNRLKYDQRLLNSKTRCLSKV